jgi:hypothetical protein
MAGSSQAKPGHDELNRVGAGQPEGEAMAGFVDVLHRAGEGEAEPIVAVDRVEIAPGVVATPVSSSMRLQNWTLSRISAESPSTDRRRARRARSGINNTVRRRSLRRVPTGRRVPTLGLTPLAARRAAPSNAPVSRRSQAGRGRGSSREAPDRAVRVGGLNAGHGDAARRCR